MTFTRAHSQRCVIRLDQVQLRHAVPRENRAAEVAPTRAEIRHPRPEPRRERRGEDLRSPVRAIGREHPGTGDEAVAHGARTALGPVREIPAGGGEDLAVRL
jgi:hypothetical protein